MAANLASSRLLPATTHALISGQLHNMAERVADPVELPDHPGITGPELVKNRSQPGPINDGAAASVPVEPLATHAFQGTALKRETLLGRGRAHVADQHLHSAYVGGSHIGGQQT